MSVLISTSGGAITIDLLTEECPLASENFLKLCKSGYYNGCLFWNVQSNYLAQSGDPTGTGNDATTNNINIYTIDYNIANVKTIRNTPAGKVNFEKTLQK